MVLVSVEPNTGWLRRYETGGSQSRLTHSAYLGEKVSFLPAMIEQFRVAPELRFSTDGEPPFSPPPGTANTGIVAA